MEEEQIELYRRDLAEAEAEVAAVKKEILRKETEQAQSTLVS